MRRESAEASWPVKAAAQSATNYCKGKFGRW